ncbi:MAG: VWA domain-containing protein, partial [Proteobacteria bacterium]|nr:VWA domain-containing protein [Pseudomonadota bacterium]
MNFIMPAGLLLGGLAVPLIALYFLRIRRRKVQVPSLLLWHALQRSERLASPFERFKRHLLLFLQLLILLALVFAFARPFLNTKSAAFRSVVLVIDMSASMGAKDERPTRFDVAVDQALEVLKGVGPTDEVMIVAAGPTTEVVSPFTRELPKARAALEGLSLT